MLNFCRQILCVYPALLVACGFIVSTAVQLAAAPLSKDECSEIKVNYNAMKKDPTIKQMSKGFEWVKENVEAADLVTIKRYLELQEKLRFQCAANVAAKPATKKNQEDAKAARGAAKKAALQAALNIPLPVRKQMSLSEQPAPVKIKIIPVKQPAKKKKKKVKTTETQPSLFDAFFPPEEETGSTAKKTKKK